MPEAKRTQLKKRIEAGEARHQSRGEPSMLDRTGEKAIEAKDKFTAFVKEHPIATVAGGLAIGVLVSSLFKRSPTRKAGRKAAGLAAVGAELAWNYAQQAMAAAHEAGRAGADRLEDLGDTVGSSARTLGRNAADRAGDLREGASAIARDAGSRIGRAVRDRIN